METRPLNIARDIEMAPPPNDVHHGKMHTEERLGLFKAENTALNDEREYETTKARNKAAELT